MKVGVVSEEKKRKREISEEKKIKREISIRQEKKKRERERKQCRDLWYQNGRRACMWIWMVLLVSALACAAHLQFRKYHW